MTSQPPAAISTLTMELIHTLSVADAMSAPVICADPADTFRAVQRHMKKHAISGVPVARGGRLLGIVSVENLLRAFDFGYIDEPIEPHMTRNVIALDAAMPLSYALTFFKKYHFGRFPVLDTAGTICGILTGSDVLRALFAALNREVDRRGDPPAVAAGGLASTGQGAAREEFAVKRFDFTSGGTAAGRIKQILQQAGLSAAIVRRAAIISYELEMNLIIHSQGGTLCFSFDGARIEICARDSGPGIEDTEQAMQDGFSTATPWVRSMGFGAGMGLANVKRNADRFELRSACGLGTMVTAIIETDPATIDGGA